jgi:hypothetical protein
MKTKIWKVIHGGKFFPVYNLDWAYDLFENGKARGKEMNYRKNGKALLGSSCPPTSNSPSSDNTELSSCASGIYIKLRKK